MVCQYFLSEVGDGAKPEEIVSELVAFVARNAPEDKQFLATVERKRPALVSLLTPKPGMRRAMKVEYLAHGPQPTVDSFQTICDVRPVFERTTREDLFVACEEDRPVPVAVRYRKLEPLLDPDRDLLESFEP
ncbi:MAG: hypothetical protein ACRELF_00625 [Gemmataceae bacterium]